VTTFSDNFTASVEEGLELRPGWTRSGGAANNVRATPGGSARNLDTGSGGTAYLATSSGSANHYAEGRILSGLGTGAGFPFICRLQDPNNWPAGLRSNGTGALQVFQRSGGTLTQLGTNIALAPGLTSSDVFRLEVSGTTATIYRNGTSIGTRSISSSINPSGTSAGLLGRTDARDPWIDDWSSGPLSAAAVSAELAVSVTLDAGGRVRLRSAAELGVSASLDAVGRLRLGGAAELASLAQIDATGRMRLRGAVEFSLPVTLDAASSSTAGGGAELFVSVSIDAAGQARLRGAAELAVGAALDANGRLLRRGSAELAVGAALDAAARLRFRGSADLVAGVTLDAAGRLRARGSADLVLSVVVDAAGGVRGAVVLVPLPRSVVRAVAPVSRVEAVAPERLVRAVAPVRIVRARRAA
jgi:hypothetical protein